MNNLAEESAQKAVTGHKSPGLTLFKGMDQSCGIRAVGRPSGYLARVRAKKKPTKFRWARALSYSVLQSG